MDGKLLEKTVKERIKALQGRIAKAAQEAGRNPSDIELCAVSKRQENSKIQQAYDCGLKIFGENYVQELTGKMDAIFQEDIQWHYIGPLQRNKVKYIIGRVSLIQSLDRFSLAQEISKQCEKNNCEQGVLVQVNIGDEETKTGIRADEGESFIREILELPYLRIRGLMALPPLTDDEAEARSNFQRMRALLTEWQKMVPESQGPMDILSIGTSDDFELAILEGATMIRVGTDVFGPRQSKV
jgi:pyridoxal phosphate enzyme (YggS family)